MNLTCKIIKGWFFIGSTQQMRWNKVCNWSDFVIAWHTITHNKCKIGEGKREKGKRWKLLVTCEGVQGPV